MSKSGNSSKLIAFAVFALGLSVSVTALHSLPPAGAGASVSAKAPLIEALFLRGEALYQKQCSVCHGLKGAGDGPAAYLLYPKPRDFTRREFRLISTSEMIPTDEDLFETISRGMLGSAMPPWEFLPGEDRWALVFYVRYLAELEKAKQTGEVTEAMLKTGVPWEIRERLARGPKETASVISVSPEPARTPESLMHGREMFLKACAACHGQEGRGDGQQMMQDNLGFPLRPRDLTSGLFKGPSTSEALYRRLAAGLPGTPMPSYREALTDEQIWELVHYVQTLPEAGKEEWLRLKRNQIEAGKIEGEIPTDPLAEPWQAVRPTFIALTPLWWRTERVEGVEVKALHNGNQIAFHLSWSDSTEDKSTALPQLFSDGAAIQFSFEKDPPFFGMGGKEGAVHLWHWKASWQEEVKGWEDIEKVYPHAGTDWYESDKSYQYGTPFETQESRTEFHDPNFVTAWGAQNPLSSPLRKSALEEAKAKGVGTLTSQPSEAPRGKAEGNWLASRWQLLFVREMKAESAGDIEFKPGETVNVSFAVWDGSAGDRDGQKSVSIWNELRIEG